MVTVIRTDSDNPDFIKLVSLLDADLAERDGEDHSFYAPFNTVQALKHVVVLYDGGAPTGCGAMKELAPNTMEIKRMYTLPESRGQGYASTVLRELEDWAMSLSYTHCRLETGKRQPEAISLYKKNGYVPIPNYGQYAGVENSCCFEKVLPVHG